MKTLSRRSFGKLSSLAAAGALLPLQLSIAGCGALTVLQKIIADIPVGVDILNAIIKLVSPGNIALLNAVSEYVGLLTGKLNEALAIVQQFKADLSKMPATAIGRIDAILAEIRATLPQLTALFPLASPLTTQIGVAVSLITFIVDSIFSLLPAVNPAQKMAAPHAQAEVNARASEIHAHAAMLPNAHDMAKQWNAVAPDAKVRVPGGKFLGIF